MKKFDNSTPTHSGMKQIHEAEKELESLAANAYNTLELVRTAGEISYRTEKLIADLDIAVSKLKDGHREYFESSEYSSLIENIEELTLAIRRNRWTRLGLEAPTRA